MSWTLSHHSDCSLATTLVRVLMLMIIVVVVYQVNLVIMTMVVVVSQVNLVIINSWQKPGEPPLEQSQARSSLLDWLIVEAASYSGNVYDT